MAYVKELHHLDATRKRDSFSRFDEVVAGVDASAGHSLRAWLDGEALLVDGAKIALRPRALAVGMHTLQLVVPREPHGAMTMPPVPEDAKHCKIMHMGWHEAPSEGAVAERIVFRFFVVPSSRLYIEKIVPLQAEPTAAYVSIDPSEVEGTIHTQWYAGQERLPHLWPRVSGYPGGYALGNGLALRQDLVDLLGEADGVPGFREWTDAALKAEAPSLRMGFVPGVSLTDGASLDSFLPSALEPRPVVHADGTADDATFDLFYRGTNDSAVNLTWTQCNGCYETYTARHKMPSYAWTPTGLMFNEKAIFPRMSYLSSAEFSPETDAFAVSSRDDPLTYVPQGEYHTGYVKCIAVIAFIYASHYAHFTLETVPKVLQVLPLIKGRPECGVMMDVYTSGRPHYIPIICQMFEFFGISCDAILEPHFLTHWRADEMYFTNPLAGAHAPSMRFARQTIWNLRPPKCELDGHHTFTTTCSPCSLADDRVIRMMESQSLPRTAETLSQLSPDCRTCMDAASANWPTCVRCSVERVRSPSEGLPAVVLLERISGVRPQCRQGKARVFSAQSRGRVGPLVVAAHCHACRRRTRRPLAWHSRACPRRAAFQAPPEHAPSSRNQRPDRSYTFAVVSPLRLRCLTAPTHTARPVFMCAHARCAQSCV
jgi:hypothetical protein